MWWSIYANDYRRIIYLNCGERYDCSSQLYTQKHRFCGPWFYQEDAESKEQQNVKNTTREKIQVISIDHRPWPQPRFQGKIPRNEVALTSCKETIKPPRWARMGIRKKSLVFLFSLIFIILQPIRIKSIMKLSRVARSVKHAQRAQKKERKKERIAFQDASLTHYPGSPQGRRKDQCCRAPECWEIIFCSSSFTHAWRYWRGEAMCKLFLAKVRFFLVVTLERGSWSYETVSGCRFL